MVAICWPFTWYWTTTIKNLWCSVVMLTVNCCTTLWSSMLNCVLLRFLSLHETVTFCCNKRFFFFSGGNCLSVCGQRKYQFCPGSREVGPSFCCHRCPVFAGSLFCLSHIPISNSLIFSQHPSNCYHVKRIWYELNGKGNILLSGCLWNPTSFAHIGTANSPNSALKCWYL